MTILLNRILLMLALHTSCVFCTRFVYLWISRAEQVEAIADSVVRPCTETLNTGFTAC